MSDSKRNPEDTSLIPPETIQKFLLHVVKGEQNEVEKMLKENPSLAFEKGDVTDYSGRQFKKISGFQYALWAMDTDMWQVMLPEKIETSPPIAKEQLQEVEHSGVTYIMPEPITDEQKEETKKEAEEERKQIADKIASDQKANQDHSFLAHPNLIMLTLSYHAPETKTEHHYDFKLIEALQAYVNCINKIYKERKSDYTNELAKKDWENADSIWQHIVGGAQRLVPVHIANQYCRTDLDFYSPPTFKANEKLSLKNQRTSKFTHGGAWYPLDGDLAFRLGVNFGVLKGPNKITLTWAQLGDAARAAERDLDFMIALHKIRQQDLAKLMTQLDVTTALTPSKKV